MPFDVPDKPTDENGGIEPRAQRRSVERDEAPKSVSLAMIPPDVWLGIMDDGIRALQQLEREK